MSRRAREPSSKRKRLHILYLLNDVLYHVHVRSRDSSFSVKLEPFLPDLVQCVATFSNSPKHAKKIQGLVDLWDENQYFAPGFIEKLRTIIQEAPKLHKLQSEANGTADGTGAVTRSSKDAPFIMPSIHGDASAPWYDLPAANWLPVIEPNSTRPMNPDMVKPLQFVPGPADKRLIQAVTDLLADVDRIYAKDRIIGDDPAEDIDQLGQRIIIDEITGDVIGGETYYGWSRPFCQKMKQRRKKSNGSNDGRRGQSMSGSRSPSRSSSRSSSRPAFKRRRMSGSLSPSRSRSQSRNYREGGRRQRSYSSSRSPSPPRRGWRDSNQSQSRSRSRSWGRSPLPQPPLQHQLPPSYGNPQQQQQGGYPNGGKQQPPGYHPHSQPPSFQPQIPNPQFQPPPHLHGSFPPHIPPPGDFNQFMVPPPPPPPNYQGQWPPPPPPLPLGGGAMPNWMPNVAATAGWGGPPLHPQQQPFQHQQQQQQQPQGHHYQDGGGGSGDYQYGRGGGEGRGNYRGRAHRGGWNRGRGGW